MANSPEAVPRTLTGKLKVFKRHSPIPEGVEELVEGLPVVGNGKEFFYKLSRNKKAIFMATHKADRAGIPAPKTFLAVPGSVRRVDDVQVEEEQEWQGIMDRKDERQFQRVIDHKVNVDRAFWKRYSLLRPNDLTLDLSLVDRGGNVYVGENEPPYLQDHAQSKFNKERQRKESARLDEKELRRVLKGKLSWRDAEFVNDRFLRGIALVATSKRDDGVLQDCVCRYRWEIRLEKQGTRYLRLRKRENPKSGVRETVAELRVNKDGQPEVLDVVRSGGRGQTRGVLGWRALSEDEALLRYLWPLEAVHPAHKRWPPNFFELMGQLRRPQISKDDGGSPVTDSDQDHSDGEIKRLPRLPSIDSDARSPVEAVEPFPLNDDTQTHERVANKKSQLLSRWTRTWPGPDEPAAESGDFRAIIPPMPGLSRPGARPIARGLAQEATSAPAPNKHLKKASASKKARGAAAAKKGQESSEALQGTGQQEKSTEAHQEGVAEPRASTRSTKGKRARPEEETESAEPASKKRRGPKTSHAPPTQGAPAPAHGPAPTTRKPKRARPEDKKAAQPPAAKKPRKATQGKAAKATSTAKAAQTTEPRAPGPGTEAAPAIQGEIGVTEAVEGRTGTQTVEAEEAAGRTSRGGRGGRAKTRGGPRGRGKGRGRAKK